VEPGAQVIEIPQCSAQSTAATCHHAISSIPSIGLRDTRLHTAIIMAVII